MVFHVLNRANNRDDMFDKDEDYLAFLRVMRDTLKKKPMRILAFCFMPNHWHLLFGSVDNVLCPRIIRRCLTGH